jgi:HlyD family secretion protein
MTSTPLRPSMPKRRPARRRALRWVKRGLLALLGAGVLTALAYAFVPRPVEVDVAAARRTPLDVEVDEDGQTRVVDRFVVSAPISGYLARIGLEAGAGVARGDVVARIQAHDPSLLDERSRSQALAQLDAAIAHAHRADTAIARATAARDAAVRDADRARTLASRGAITAYDREQYELA